MARWRAGQLIDPISRLAKNQTKGKGRAGRSWFTQPNVSLSFSLAYPFNGNIKSLQGLSLVCGLATIRGISKSLHMDESKLREHGLALKWPNDLLIHDRKLGGLLIEGGRLSSNSPNEKTWMIIGIGMNLSYSKALELASQISISYLSELNQNQATMDADLVWLSILDALGEYLSIFEKRGFAAFHDQWEYWDAYRDLPVEISEFGQSKYIGIAKGVNDEGALLLLESGNNEPTVVYAGDVSLRKKS